MDQDDPNAAFSSANLSTETVFLAMNAIKLTHTTTAEHSIGSFICRKLQQLDTWPALKQGKISQVDKMAKLEMDGKPYKAPCKAMILHPH